MDLPATLRGIVGERYVLTDPDLTTAYSEDWTRRWRGKPRAVVSPGSTAEVAAVVRECAAAGAPLVPQGGNTGLVGGGVPQDGEIVLSTRRLSAVGPVDPLARTVDASAGATLGAVQRAAREAGFDVGIDFGARDSATVGGIAATNAGGERVLRHGVTRSQVRGVEAVLGDGSVIRRMSGLPKDNTGYDLPQLLVGSEGTLGVITEVRLRLVPPARPAATALVAVNGVEAALEALEAVRQALPGLDAAEYFHDDGLQLVRRHTDLRSPFGRPHPVYLLVEVAGAEPAVEELAAVLGDTAAVRDAVLAGNAADRRALWQLRELHPEAIGAEGVPVKLDIAVPLHRLAEFEHRLPDVVRGVARHAVPILFGHIAEGNVHVNLLDAEEADRDGAVTEAVLRLVAELGGSISAEHGIGLAKRRWLPLTRGPAEIAAMRAVKHALDPAGIMSPGRVLA